MVSGDLMLLAGTTAGAKEQEQQKEVQGEHQHNA